MRIIGFAIVLALLVAAPADATETEHLGMKILPAPEKVSVDGKSDDWDLSGGIFVCSDVENLRDTMSVWFHLMFDAENLYVLARVKDPLPMSNPKSTKKDFGDAGDVVQIRMITAPDVVDKERTTHVTPWCDSEGLDVIQISYGKKFNEGSVKDAQAEGAEQVFSKDADGKGYVQEISLPWKLLTKGGYVPEAGERIVITLEPHFNLEDGGQVVMRDNFRPGVEADRRMTYVAWGCWGFGTLEKTGKVKPQAVRLSDDREFPVEMKHGLPAVDWAGL